MGLLDGKVAVITGAGGGLGRAHALLFAAEGARVVVNDLGGAADGSGAGRSMADKVVDEIRAAGGQAAPSYDSVATPEGGLGICKAALDAFGQIDILINNAGILRDRTLVNTEPQDWDGVVAVHLRGTYCVTRPVFQHMKERGKGGVIVNTSSTSGLIGNFGQCNYGAAKAGIAGFTRCLALEGKKYGIRVWGLAPVAFTRLTEPLMARGDERQREAAAEALDPARVSPVVLYMCSELSGDKTGKILYAGGSRVAELKIVGPEGLRARPGQRLTAYDIAAAESQVYLPDDAGFHMGT